MLANIGLLFYIISNDFFTVRYGFDQIESGVLLSKVYLASILIGPIFGLISDYIGHRVTFSIVSASIIALSWFMLILIPSSTTENRSYLGVVPLFLMKVASSILISVVYPAISYIVKPQVCGSAYGVFSSLLNATLAFGPYIIAYFTFQEDKESTYFWVWFILGFVSLIGALWSLYLLQIDKKWFNNILQNPSKQNEWEGNEVQIFQVETLNLASEPKVIESYIKSQ